MFYKKIIISIVFLTLASATLKGNDIERRLAALERIIADQQQEIKLLKEQLEVQNSQKEEDLFSDIEIPDEQNEIVSTTTPNQIENIQEDLDDFDERLTEVELRSYTDKVQFGLGMRVEANSISSEYADGSSPKNEDMAWKTKLNLNLQADITDHLKFTGKLSMYKNWGDSVSDQFSNMDAMQGRVSDNSSGLFVERAYVDWQLNPDSKHPLFLTIGRQPSGDGPSYHIKESTKRKGTYDALAFDGAADGVVLSWNLNICDKGATALRLAYGVPNNGSDYNSEFMKNTQVGGFFIDKKLCFIEEEHLVQAYYVTAEDLMGSPSLGSGDRNIGGLDISGGMFEIQDLYGFDFFAHYAKNRLKPNGETVMIHGNEMGLLSSKSSTKSVSGDAFWLGTRYNFNNNWATGIEYNKGSKNWFSFTFAPNDFLNKLATRGEAWEYYLTYKINQYANLRLGHTAIDYDYSGSGSWLGEPMKIDSSMGNSVIKEAKNTYLNFTLLF